MADNDKSPPARGQGYQEADLGAGLMDVIMRGLELTKRRIEEESGPDPRTFCAFAYAVPGDVCFFVYYHRQE